jgi:hypothetical protein
MSGIESLLIGRVLGGRYRIEEVIGRGGMGAVYRAIDERLGRQVALKVITVGTGDPEARDRLRARFFREARSAALLPHHPNVVPVYDYGSDEALGLDYLVMELLRGSDLATRLGRSGAPPLAASLKILIEAARGVAVGHRQGLIHRDIKPGNIFLAQTHSNEVQVRVVDFGIAKLADDEDTLAQLTQDGRVPHSPAYASPEQLRGLTQLTPASDVFSLGAVGFQLLTGERPFSENDRNKLSLGMAVKPPSARERNPAIPGAVDEILRRSLEFEAEDRYRDAAEMASALESAVRTIADFTIEPYLGGAPIVTAVEADDRTHLAEADEDRTQLVEAEDDRTLLAPVPPGASPPRQELPPRGEVREPRPRREEAATRRGVGGLLVWGLVIFVLAAAGLWAWSSMQEPLDLSGRLPAPPDTLPEVVIPELPLEDTVPFDLANTAVESYNQGVRFHRAGAYDSAAVYFRRAAAIIPTESEYWRSLGVALLSLNQPAEAEGALLEAVRLAPERSGTYASLFNAQMMRNDTTRAMASLEEYIRREEDPRLRQSAEGRLSELRRALEPEPDTPPLLGEPVTRP